MNDDLDPADPESGDEEELEKTAPNLVGEEDISGDNPDPGLINQTDTLERAQKMGQYPKADEEHPTPLNSDNVDDTQG